MQQDPTRKRGGVSEEGSGPHERGRVAWQGQVTRARRAQGFVQIGKQGKAGEGLKHRVAYSGLHFEEKTGCCCVSAWRGAGGGEGGLVCSRPGRRCEAQGQDKAWRLKVSSHLFCVYDVPMCKKKRELSNLQSSFPVVIYDDAVMNHQGILP